MELVRAFGRNTFSSLKIRNYRLFFIGQGISLSGTWMQTIGQSWLVLQLTGSGTALGLVTAAQYLPILLFAPLGGVLADRFSKRKILFFTAVVSGLLSLVMGVLVATHLIQLWMVYLVAAGLGLVTALDNPTRQTFMFEMAGADELVNAVSLNSSEVNMARVIGPAIGGLLIAAVGLAPLFLLNAASYVAVMAMLFLMDPLRLHRAPLVAKAKGQLRAGFRYAWHNAELRLTLIMLFIVGTLAYEWQVSLPLIAEFVFHAGASGYASMNVMQGLGAVAGGLYAAGHKRQGPRLLSLAALLFGIALLMVALAPSFGLALAAMFAVGASSITLVSLGNTTLQLVSSPEMRGRVMSLWTVAFLGSTPIGGPIIGYVGQHLGPRWGLAIGGFSALFAAGLGWLTLRRSQANLPKQA